MKTQKSQKLNTITAKPIKTQGLHLDVKNT